MNSSFPLRILRIAPLAALALVPSLGGQDLSVESFSFPSSDQVSITAKGLSPGPNVLRLRAGPDLDSFTDADFPFFTDLGGGRFSLRGNHGQSSDRAFFQVQVDPGSESFTPDLSLGVASRSEENGFGAWQVKTADNAVYTGGLEVSFTGPGNVGGLALPSTRTFNLRSNSVTLQTFGGFDDAEVNGPRYVYMRIVNDETFGDGAVLDHIVVIHDNDAYYRGFIDAPDFPFEFRFKYARTNPPDGISPKVQVLELESDGSGILPAGTYPLEGKVFSTALEASGEIPGIAGFGDGLEVNLEVEFLWAGGALEFSAGNILPSRITGTARVTQRVVSSLAGGSAPPIEHLTRVLEGPYTLTREPAPLRDLNPGLLPE